MTEGRVEGLANVARVYEEFVRNPFTVPEPEPMDCAFYVHKTILRMLSETA